MALRCTQFARFGDGSAQSCGDAKTMDQGQPYLHKERRAHDRQRILRELALVQGECAPGKYDGNQGTHMGHMRPFQELVQKVEWQRRLSRARATRTCGDGGLLIKTNETWNDVAQYRTCSEPGNCEGLVT